MIKKRNVLQFYIAQRLKTFNEEELDMKLVLFDEMLEHILRIDCVLRKPMGHLVLIGESGTGKTALSRFVSWLNSISVFQIKPTRRYNVANFDDDLRCIMRRAGVNGERICFVSFDEFMIISIAPLWIKLNFIFEINSWKLTSILKFGS